MLPLDIPLKVSRKAASLGEAGLNWLNELPHRILALQRRWGVEIGQPYANGTEAFVVRARTMTGEEAVLKMVAPGIDPMRQEIHVLRAADGKGYAKLLRADEDQNILLVEKLGTQLHQLGLEEDQQLKIICSTLQEAWKVAEDPRLPTGADKALEFARLIESNRTGLAGLCSERTVEIALCYTERRRRAFDAAASVLVHGDAHQWNTLQAPGSATGFKFIDPDGARAEPAFDLAIPMREWGNVIPNGDLLALGRRRCRALAEFSGADEKAIWEWGFVQCVTNGILLSQLGVNDSAAVEFAMASAWSN